MIEINHPEELAIDDQSLGPWSHSKLKLLKNCPWQFYLKYIAKAKPDVVPISQLAENGKAVHRILELVACGKDVDESFRRTRQEFMETVTDSIWTEKIMTCEFSIMEFKRRMDEFDKKHGIKRVLTEFKVGVTYDYERTGFFADDVWFRGVIDLAFMLRDGDAIIIDHKKGGGGFGIRNYSDQLETYKILMHYGIEPIRGAQSGIHFVEAGEISLDRYQDASQIENSLSGRLKFYVNGAIDSVKEAGYFKHKSCNSCKYCDFAVQCKSGEMKAEEKKTMKFFKIEDMYKDDVPF